jgi:uncharacterized protein YoxC
MKTKLTNLGLNSKIDTVTSLEIEADKLSVEGVDLLKVLKELEKRVANQENTIESLCSEVDKLQKDVEKLSKKQPKEKDVVKE